MEFVNYLKRLEEIQESQRRRIICINASIEISNESATIVALKHDSALSNSLHETEIVDQRLGFDSAIQGGILEIYF